MKRIYLLVVFIISFFIFNNKLGAISDISVSNAFLTPLFEERVKVYNVYVEDSREIVTISASGSDNEVIKGIGSKNLIKGLNTFKIESYLDDKLMNVYTINIVRGEETINEEDSYLTSLYIPSYNIDFKSDIFDYYIDEYKTNSKVYYETNNPLTSVSVKEKDNKYVIKVISENKKNTSVYTISFKSEEKKEESINKNIDYIKYILLITFCLVVIVSFIVLFCKHKRR